MHGNNKSRSRADPGGRGRRRSHRRGLVRRDRAAGRDRRRRRASRQRVLVRVTVGRRGAHARIHRHGPRGPEVRLLGSRGSSARDACLRIESSVGWPRWSLSDCIRTSARRSSTCPVSSVAAKSRGGPAGRDPRSHTRRPAGRDRPRRRAGHRLCRRRREPRRPTQSSPTELRAHRGAPSARSPGLTVPAAVGRARARDRRAERSHRLRSRHDQDRRSWARAAIGAYLRLGRRRDERQHPHRALRRVNTPACWRTEFRRPSAMLARVVGKHCESGDIVVRDVLAALGRRTRGSARRRGDRARTATAWPATTTTCPRPPVIGVRDGVELRHRAPRDRGRPAAPGYGAARGACSHGQSSERSLHCPAAACGSPCWAAGSSAPRSSRLLREQADRPRRARRPRRWSWSASPSAARTSTPTCAGRAADHRRRRAGRARRRRHRGRGDRRHRAGSHALLLSALKERARAWSARTRPCWPRMARAARRREPPPASICTTRPPWPGRSRCCARCASP